MEATLNFESQLLPIVNKIKQVISQLPPEAKPFFCTLANNLRGIYGGLTQLRNISEVESIMTESTSYSKDDVSSVIKKSGLNTTIQKDVMEHCKPSGWFPRRTIIDNRERLLRSIQEEKQSIANKHLFYSVISSGIAIYIQFEAIRAVVAQLKNAKFILEESAQRVVELTVKLEAVGKLAENLRSKIEQHTNQNDSDDFSTQSINEIRSLSFGLILKHCEIVSMLGTVKLQVENGIATLQASAMSQDKAMKLNLTQGVMNCVQLFTVGAPASTGMQVLFGFLTGGFFLAAKENYRNTVCCKDTLVSLNSLMETIDELGKIVTTIQDVLDTAERICQSNIEG